MMVVDDGESGQFFLEWAMHKRTQTEQCLLKHQELLLIYELFKVVPCLVSGVVETDLLVNK